MPARHIRLEQRAKLAVLLEHAAVRNDPVLWRREVDVRIKSRIEKRDRHAFAGETVIRVEPQRCGQNMRAVLLNRSVSFDLVLRSFE
jgi:hypothetical protein